MGRPSRAGTPADRGVFLRVTALEHDAIRQWADAQGSSMADAIRLLVMGEIADAAELNIETPAPGDPSVTRATGPSDDGSRPA